MHIVIIEVSKSADPIIEPRKEDPMETPFQPQVDLNDLSPEVRAYIFQTLMEFEPYTSPNTTVAVVAKNPLKLKDDPRFEEMSQDELSQLWRISIALTEEGTTIQAEGVAQDIYAAIREATHNLVKQLSEIHDQVISTQDRMMQIQNATSGTQLH